RHHRTDNRIAAFRDAAIRACKQYQWHFSHSVFMATSSAATSGELASSLLRRSMATPYSGLIVAISLLTSFCTSWSSSSPAPPATWRSSMSSQNILSLVGLEPTSSMPLIASADGLAAGAFPAVRTITAQAPKPRLVMTIRFIKNLLIEFFPLGA